MKNIVFSIIFIVSFFSCKAQLSNQAGDWKWSYQSKHKTIFKINSIQNNTIMFNYCSVFYDGKKVDCNQDVSFKLNKVNSHIYEGNFQSAFNDKNIDLRIKFNSDFTEFETEIFSQLNGEHYFPDNVIFKKN